MQKEERNFLHKIVSPSFIIQFKKNSQKDLEHKKFSCDIVAPKKLIPLAVNRNRIRRVIREHFLRELAGEDLSGIKFRFQVRPKTGDKKNLELFKELKQFLGPNSIRV